MCEYVSLNVYLGCRESEKRGGIWGNKCRKERPSLVRTRHTGKGGEKGGDLGLSVNTTSPSFPDEPWEKNPPLSEAAEKPKGSWVQTQPCEL